MRKMKSKDRFRFCYKKSKKKKTLPNIIISKKTKIMYTKLIRN